MADQDMLEDTTEIEQGDARVPPMLIVLIVVLTLIGIAYFCMNLVRPS
jgi:hypothetical protein